MRSEKKETLTLIVVFLFVLLASGYAAYYLAGKATRQKVTREAAKQADIQRQAEPPERRSSPQGNRSNDAILGQVFDSPPQSQAEIQGETWGEILATLTLRLVLAALLGALLAFRPRRRVLVLKPNPYVAQTQILLAVVASALMIIVGDNAARAFGIFAAVSVVRFRTNIRIRKR